MEKRSIFMIAFSVIGIVLLSVLDQYMKNELIEWLVILVYLLVVFITMYLPGKKEEKKEKSKKSKRN